MRHTEMKKLLPYKMEELKNKPISIGNKRKKTKSTLAMRALQYSLLLCTLGIGYYFIGNILQYLDPTIAWLDLGTLSLALFAAWCCMLGVAIAGLLPAVYMLIGKKGGISIWKIKKDHLWSILVFVGYIALLCCLL